MNTVKYVVGTPMGEFKCAVADTSTVGEFLEWLVTSGKLNAGDILELCYDGILVPNHLTFGTLNLHDGYRLDVIATGTSV